MNPDKKLYIIGCGGHARSVADVYLSLDTAHTIVFFDENARKGEKIFGYDVLKLSDYNENTGVDYFVALGDNEKREKLFIKYEGNGHIVSILSNSAYISEFAELGKGIFVGNFTHVGPEVEIGDNTIVNTASVIEHGVKIGAHSHIAPNVAISGNTVIGKRNFIGVGASIKDGISICDNVIIGAGSVVIANIYEGGTYVGCPAKRIK